MVDLLLQRQRCHPVLEGFPTAARIGDLPLFLGAASAAQVRASHPSRAYLNRY